MSGGPPIVLRVNGEDREVPAGSSVLALLSAAGHDPRAVAIELNGEILRRPDWAETALRAGDRLEVVRFVQGG